jgi:hypothetical protein
MLTLFSVVSLALFGCGGNRDGSDDTSSNLPHGTEGSDSATDTWTDSDHPTVTGDTADTAVTDTSSQTSDTADTTTVEYVDNFEMYTVAKTVVGAAFATIDDVDGDGVEDIVVSCFGPMSDPTMKGEVVMFSMGNNLTDWIKTTIVPKSINISFPNTAIVRNMDDDTDKDVFLPSGFLACQSNPLASNCGALNWFEQIQGGGWVRHGIVNDQPLFYHSAAFADLNKDGLEDFVTVGEKKPLVGASSAKVQVFFGVESDARFSTTPVELGLGLGSLPQLVDIDEDGDLDILSAEYFHNNAQNVSFAWFEQAAAPVGTDVGTWTRHVIADDLGPSIQIALVPNLYKDGVMRAVGTNHTNTKDNANSPQSQALVFDLPESVRSKWPYTKISEGIVSDKSPAGAPQGAPGVFALGDVDGDGDLDVAVSGDGDDRVFILEQTSAGKWKTHVMHETMGQAGVAIGDVDNDGQAEVVFTSYEKNTVRVFKWKK